MKLPNTKFHEHYVAIALLHVNEQTGGHVEAWSRS
jgi:hypothetical protein